MLRNTLYQSNYNNFTNNASSLNRFSNSNESFFKMIDGDSKIIPTFCHINTSNDPTDLSETISHFLTRVETLASTFSDNKERKTMDLVKKTETKLKTKTSIIVKNKLLFNKTRKEESSLLISPKDNKIREKIKELKKENDRNLNLPIINQNLSTKTIVNLREKKAKLNVYLKDCLKKNDKLNKEVVHTFTDNYQFNKSKVKLKKLVEFGKEKEDHLDLHKTLGRVSIKPKFNAYNSTNKVLAKLAPPSLDSVMKIDSLEVYKFRKVIVDKYKELIEDDSLSAEEIRYRIEREIRNKKHKFVTDLLNKNSEKKAKLDVYVSQTNQPMKRK